MISYIIEIETILLCTRRQQSNETSHNLSASRVHYPIALAVIVVLVTGSVFRPVHVLRAHICHMSRLEASRQRLNQSRGARADAGDIEPAGSSRFDFIARSSEL